MNRIFRMGAVGGLVALAFLCCSPVSARDDEWKGKLEDALTRMEDKIEAMRKLLGEESKPQRDLCFEYVIYLYDGKSKEPLTPYTSSRAWWGPAYGTRDIPPPAEHEQDVYWLMQIDWVIKLAQGRTFRDFMPPRMIHMVRIQKGESPDAAIGKILERYKRDVAKKGALREVFIHDHVRGGRRLQSKEEELPKFEARKVAGPFDSFDEAAEWLRWDVRGRQTVYVIWDNPPRELFGFVEKDDEIYYAFWKHLVIQDGERKLENW